MSISPFAFDPVNGWADQTTFPTYLDDEPTIRAKYQLLHDQTKNWLNNTLIPAVENLDTAVAGLDAVKNVTVNMTDSPGTAYSTIVDALDSGAKVWCKYDYSTIIPLTYFLRAPTSNTFIFCGLVGKSQMLWVRLQYYMGGQWSYQFIDLQDKLTFDDAPTSGSNNPVKSGGVYTALSGKQDVLTFDNVPTENSNNPVKSNGVYTAIAAVKAVKIADTESAETAYTKASGAYSNHSPCYVEKNGALYWLAKRTKINNNQAQKSYITFYFSSISSYGDFRTVYITATVPYPNVGGDTSYGWGSFIASPIPNGAGTYVLKATRATAGATPTYEWVAET